MRHIPKPAKDINSRTGNTLNDRIGRFGENIINVNA